MVDGKEVAGTSIKSSISAGLGLVPEDRKTEGLIQELSVLKNIGLAKLADQGKMVLNNKQEEADCYDMIRQMEIKTANIDLAVKSLSGGNQQKVLLAKWILLNPKVLIIDEPTRGVDIGATKFIHEQIVAARDRGCAVVLVSTELDEIMSLSDRIGVIYEGVLLGEMDRADANYERLGLLMAGKKETAETVS